MHRTLYGKVLVTDVRARIKMGGVFFGALVFLVPFVCCGWLVSARTVPLLQAVAGKKTRISAEFRIFQPNTPFRA